MGVGLGGVGSGRGGKDPPLPWEVGREEGGREGVGGDRGGRGGVVEGLRE